MARERELARDKELLLREQQAREQQVREKPPREIQEKQPHFPG